MMPLDLRFDEPDLPAAILTHINFICHLLESSRGTTHDSSIKTARTKEGSCNLLLSICASRELGLQHPSGSHVITACPRQDWNPGLPRRESKIVPLSYHNTDSSLKTARTKAQAAAGRADGAGPADSHLLSQC